MHLIDNACRRFPSAWAWYTWVYIVGGIMILLLLCICFGCKLCCRRLNLGPNAPVLRRGFRQNRRQ